MTNVAVGNIGLSGDFGWDELEQPALNGVGVVSLLAASGAYWASLWILGGLPPLASVISFKRSTSRK